MKNFNTFALKASAGMLALAIAAGYGTEAQAQQYVPPTVPGEGTYTPPTVPPEGSNPGNTVTVDNSNTNTNTNTNTAHGGQGGQGGNAYAQGGAGGEGGQGGQGGQGGNGYGGNATGGNATGGNATGGNAQSNATGGNVSGAGNSSVNIRNVGATNAPGINSAANGPCTGTPGWSVAAGGVGGYVGGGKTRLEFNERCGELVQTMEWISVAKDANADNATRAMAINVLATQAPETVGVAVQVTADGYRATIENCGEVKSAWDIVARTCTPAPKVNVTVNIDTTVQEAPAAVAKAPARQTARRSASRVSAAAPTNGGCPEGTTPVQTTVCVVKPK